MKKILFILLLLCSISSFSTEILEMDDCYIKYSKGYEGFGQEIGYYRLCANVYLEKDPTQFADFKVCVYSKNFPFWDICIYPVKGKPTQCGHWRFVDNPTEADFSIKIVEDYSDAKDFSIKFVNSPDEAGF